jgi:hypothetical protein
MKEIRTWIEPKDLKEFLDIPLEGVIADWELIYRHDKQMFLFVAKHYKTENEYGEAKE